MQKLGLVIVRAGDAEVRERRGVHALALPRQAEQRRLSSRRTIALPATDPPRVRMLVSSIGARCAPEGQAAHGLDVSVRDHVGRVRRRRTAILAHPVAGFEHGLERTGRITEGRT